ncbi:MAG: hypothetical protein Q8K26_01575, partial [Candidatus Gracilibacteria bacterium]|nr:hypothetical protein [Candidatus Gracilibacteria bacterium]
NIERLGTSDQVRTDIDALKKELIPAVIPEVIPPAKIIELQKLFEIHAREPLTTEKLSYVLDKLPNNDSVARSFMMRGIIGKLRADGFVVTNKSNDISIETTIDDKKVIGEDFQKILDTKVQKTDIEEALIISSGSFGDFKDTYKGDISKATNNEYVQSIMTKYKLATNVSIQEVQDNEKISAEEKSLLISAISGGITKTTPLNQAIINYDTTKKNMEELLSSPGFKQAEKLVAQATGELVPPTNTKDLAKKVTEDPVGALSGKPLTTIGAGLALVYGLGYEKGKGFSLWTGLKRGFMGLIALFLGNGIAKEWGMDPKELMKEGMSMMRDGGEKVGEAAQSAVTAVTGQEAGGTKPGEVTVLTETQK